MTWNIGQARNENDTYSISTLSQMEKAYSWIGSVGLASKSEYMKANVNTTCTAFKLYSEHQNSSYTCRQTNYLWKSDYWWWLLNSYSGYAYSVLSVNASGYVFGSHAYYTGGSVRPSLFLKSNITLTGTGTNDENIFSIS